MQRAFAAYHHTQMPTERRPRALTDERAIRAAEVIRLPTRPQSAREGSTVAAGGHRDSAVVDTLQRWIISSTAAAFVLLVVGAVLGLLSRKYLPTRSIFDLM